MGRAVGDSRPENEVIHTAGLSFAQQRLWILDRLLPDKSAYNAPRVQRLTGSLDVLALERALNEIVSRHEILRTRFALVDGTPRQVIVAASSRALTVEDLSALPVSDREGIAKQRARQEAQTPFDLERGPPLRWRLLRLATDEHWLLLTLHHIATDRWSSAVLAQELSILYNAFARGDPPALPALPLQYSDYATWQREWLQGEVLERHRLYWKPALAELLDLALPTDRPRPAVADYKSGSTAFDVDCATTHALKELGLREGATLFMTLLAVFQILLYRYSGQEDIAVGAPIAGRTRPELENLVGFFGNMLVLRGDLSGEPSFKDYLARVRRVALDAYAHQDMPFEKLVEELAPRRDLARNPLFQVSFAFQNTMPVAWNLQDLHVERVEDVGSESAKFDFNLVVTESAGVLHGRVDYATSLFDATTIERMIGHWQKLLHAVIADPHQRISRLPLMTEHERHEWLAKRTRATTPDSREECIHQRVESQAARRPDAVAARFGELSLTYATLNIRANRLAHYLRSLGAGPDVLVAVCMERSLDMLVAMLGVLKAGAAYVPLDPAYPAERLAFVMDDTCAPILLTHRHLRSQFSSFAGKLVCLDDDGSTLAAQAQTDPRPAVTSNHLAYVIYTSGSTGQPKGVMVTHGNLARLFSATQHWFAFDERDVWTCFHSFAFDFSVWEIWGALAHGGVLIVVPYLVSRDAKQFHALLQRERVTVLNQTPSAFAALGAVDEDDHASDLALRVIILGGEALEIRTLRRWMDRHGDATPRLINMYGITETTVHVTYRPITLADLDTTLGSMIGEPIPDLHVDIVDRYMQPVAAGIPGEIVVGGAGVARGYLNRPALTAERFIADPFADDSSARLYRSGDLARRMPNGDLEYLGRIDDQAKIRGFRIEPGEVEAALLRCAHVREAVVVVQGDSPAARHLTAYVVPHANAKPTPAELWNEVRQKLPDYMVPSAIVVLPAMPLTAHGKIDRRALPKPSDIAGHRIGWPGGHVPPRDPLDHMLASIWEDLLGVRNVGIRDSFFDLGGHSLLAAQMVDTVERVCGIRVPLTTLFTHATIADFTQAMRDTALQARSPVVAINTEGSRSPMFFLHGDFTGGGFFSNALARGLGPEQPFYAVHPHGLIDADVPDSIEAMAADRLQALRAVQPHGPYVLGGHCAGALVALEIAQQLVSEGEEVPLVVIMDAAAPLQRQRIYESESVAADSAVTGFSRRQRTPRPPPVVPLADDIAARYLRAVRKYVPSPFGGRLVVLRPESKHDLRPTLGWSAITAAVEVYRIRGDHHTCITRHVDETAARLKSCMEQTAEPT